MRSATKRCIFLICACVVVSVMWMYVNIVSRMGGVYSYFSTSLIEKDPNGKLKYILEWENLDVLEPYLCLGEGNGTFYKGECQMKNCYVTSNRKLLRSVTEFDAILFDGPFIVKQKLDSYFPTQRSSNQSYIFMSMESSHNYYVSDDRFNNVFNFTMTYKLDSDISMGYIVIRNGDGQVIGPAVNIPWISINDMSPISEQVKSKLANKRKAAAWFVSNCNSLSKREHVVELLKNELNKYNLTVDIYGKCGDKVCPRDSSTKCLKAIQEEYYFYLAFENSFSEDYVTEKLLTALNNYAVPIVYGGANYTRFMPDGIYLNARNLSIVELVHRMVEAIHDTNLYYNYFKWHNHYSYHRQGASSETDVICQLCSFLNKVDVHKVSVIHNFYEWWRPEEILAHGKSVLYYLTNNASNLI